MASLRLNPPSPNATSASEPSPLDPMVPEALAIPISDVTIPTTEPALTTFKHNYVRHVLGVLMSKFEVKPGKELPKLSHDQRATVTKFLYSLAQFDEMTPTVAERGGLKLILCCMKGEDVRGKRYRLPDPFPELFRNAWDRFEGMNWGATAATGDEEDTPMEDSPTTLASSTSNLPGRIIHGASQRTSTAPHRRPRADHPIYGTNGIMRGISQYKTKTKTYAIEKLFNKRDSNVRGHNGIAVGQWWPLQICAVRDGAHGARMGGISGTEGTGVYSVVISGTYADLDTDNGHSIWYSGSNSHDNTNQDFADISAKTLAMQTALARQQQVRVLRSARGDARWSPSVGIRYDGLYTVTDERTRRNTRGGLYVMFHLVRVPGQLPIQLNRPTAMEKRLFKRVADGY